MDFGGSVELMLDFVAGRFEFYPNVDRLMRERVTAAWPPPESDDESPDDE